MTLPDDIAQLLEKTRPSPAQQARLAEWLAADPRHPHDWLTACTRESLLRRAVAARVAAEGSGVAQPILPGRRFIRRPRRRARRQRLPQILALAAVLILTGGVVLGMAWWHGNRTGAPAPTLAEVPPPRPATEPEIAPPTPPPPDVPATVASLSAGTHPLGRDRSLPYRLFEPPGASPAQPAPLVVFFHGIGERGSDNRRQLGNDQILQFTRPSWQAAYGCYLLAPQCPAGGDWLQQPVRGALHDLIDAICAAHSIDRRRVVLTGLSTGAFASWGLATDRPRRYQAIVPVAGHGDPQAVRSLAALPIWSFHGTEDRIVPIAGSRRTLAAVQAAGGQPRSTEYAGAGHDVWRRCYTDPDLRTWLAELPPAP